MRETPEELAARCHQFRRHAAGRNDWHEMLVVSHWGFIQGLTGQSVQNAEHLRFDPTAA